MDKKTIEITYFDLLNIMAWLRDEKGWYQTTNLPISTRRVFKNIVKKLNELVADYEEDENEILGKYSTDEFSEPIEGKEGQRKVKPVYLSEFNKARIELLSVKTEIEFVPLPCSVFDNIEVSGKDYAILDLFLADE